MARGYRLPKDYFYGDNVLQDVDSGALKEAQVQPIYGAWLKLPGDEGTLTGRLT